VTLVFTVFFSTISASVAPLTHPFHLYRIDDSKILSISSILGFFQDWVWQRRRLEGRGSHEVSTIAMMMSLSDSVSTTLRDPFSKDRTIGGSIYCNEEYL
jgi:hypothetical protein